MRIDAIFLVQQEAVERLEKINQEERMNYILGINDDDSFVDYLIDMDDYEQIPEQFYDTLVSKCGDLNFSNYSKIYEDKLYFIYSVDTLKSRQLLNKLLAIDSKELIKLIIENCQGKQESEDLVWQYQRFVEFLSIAELNQGDLIFSILKQ